MQKRLKIPLIVVIFLLSSCQPKEEVVTREKLLSQGFAMMDQGRNDEAISYFEDLVQKDPHFHVKLALASALAARAGVKIQEIYSFVAVRSFEVKQVSLSSLPLDKQTRELLKEVSRFSAHWEKIPALAKSGRRDIHAALKVLQEEKAPGARLYAATLRVILLKSSIQEGMQNWEIKEKRRVCLEDLKVYVEWSLRIVEGLRVLSEDLQIAFPEKRAVLQQWQQDLQKLKDEAQHISWPEEETCF
ncbi:hypothetical protein [Bdellovibrio bacteriovorus]|uniref:hypothetical protein n=1 Tax=Bdellovibrio bacteriovorus TaxID=959 RepID=UPI0035A5EE38